MLWLQIKDTTAKRCIRGKNLASLIIQHQTIRHMIEYNSQHIAAVLKLVCALMNSLLKLFSTLLKLVDQLHIGKSCCGHISKGC